jgi:hypothetical protein
VLTEPDAFRVLCFRARLVADLDNVIRTVA